MTAITKTLVGILAHHRGTRHQTYQARDIEGNVITLIVPTQEERGSARSYQNAKVTLTIEYDEANEIHMH